jgi:hypothetical protein
MLRSVLVCNFDRAAAAPNAADAYGRRSHHFNTPYFSILIVTPYFANTPHNN